MSIAETTSPNMSAAGRQRMSSLLLDLVERAALVVLFAFLIMRIAPTVGNNIGNLLILVSEGLVVLFMLIRRTTANVSRHPVEWLLAALATIGPLLVNATRGGGFIPPAFGGMIILCGLFMQMHAKIVLGRSFGMVPANRGVKLGGPYRIVRHPMYAGYLLTHVGFLLLNPSWWNLAAYSLCYSLQIPRLLAEERLLRVDSAYARYEQEVRYRLIPGVF